MPAASEGATLMAWWDDLYPPGGGTVRYLTTGTVPNRTFEVQRQIQHYAGSPGTIDVRAILYEGSSDITVCCVDTTFSTGDDDGASATVGIQNGTASEYPECSCNSAALTPGLTLQYVHP